MKQSCVLASDLFNISSEAIMRIIRDLEGINIGGQKISSIRYADDTALIADSEDKLQLLI